MKKAKRNRDIYYSKYRLCQLNYDVLYKWMYCDIYNRTVEEELRKNGIQSVAIYGAGDLGSILWNKLKESTIRVECFVDKYSLALKYGVDDIAVIRPEELKNRSDIDLIIITALGAVDAIRRDLKEVKNTIPVISLEDIIMKM